MTHKTATPVARRRSASGRFGTEWYREKARISASRDRTHHLAHEADQPGLPRAAQALGGEDLADLVEATVDVVVDDHVIVAVPVADLGLRTAHAIGDHVGAVGPARGQAAVKFL